MIRQIKFSLLPFLLIAVSAFHFLYLFSIIMNIPVKTATIYVFFIVAITVSIIFTTAKSEIFKNKFVGTAAPILILTFLAVIADKILTFQLKFFYVPVLIALLLLCFKSNKVKGIVSKIDMNFLENINIFIFAFIAYTGFGYFCNNYTSFDFDSQNFIVWEYSAIKNYIPYKDIFFPYGMLDYFTNKYIFFNLLYALLQTTIITSMFVGLKFAMKDRFFAYISLFILFILQAWFTRYGIVALMPFLYSYVLYKKYTCRRLSFLVLGIINGLIISLINDAGIYSSIVFIVGNLAYPIYLHYGFREATQYYVSLGFKFLIYVAGFFIGLIPFIFYLFKYNITVDFLRSLANIFAMGEYGKIPFWGSMIIPDNLLVSFSLILAAFAISYKYFNKKNGGTYVEVLQLFLFFALLLLSYKNVMRPVPNQINFVAVLLLLSFWKYLADFFKQEKVIKNTIRLFFVLVLFFVIFILRNNLFEIANTNILQYKSQYLHSFPLNYSRKITSADVDLCSKNNLINLKKSLPAMYLAVKDNIEKRDDFNGKIFSFPLDPVFYILFDQKPPRYFTAYDGSPLFAQEWNIEYMRKNDIRYVIYRLNYPAIDNVPFIIRNNTLFKYLLKNFRIVGRAEDYLILGRTNNGEDFFTDDFLNINLEAIPSSEGMYKKMFVDSNSNLIYESSDISPINKYLADNTVFSENKYLVLYAKENAVDKEYDLSISSEGLETKINFKNCRNPSPCIINLSNMPLFFKPRRINKISVKENIYKKIKFVEVEPNKVLW